MLEVAFQKTYSAQISWRSMPTILAKIHEFLCCCLMVLALTLPLSLLLFVLLFPIRKIKPTPPKKFPVKLHKWICEKDKAFIEFISVADNHANCCN
jgi:hypothetical protein